MQISGPLAYGLLLLLAVQFIMIAWKMIVIIRMQRDIDALNRFMRTWGERMLAKLAIGLDGRAR